MVGQPARAIRLKISPERVPPVLLSIHYASFEDIRERLQEERVPNTKKTRNTLFIFSTEDFRTKTKPSRGPGFHRLIRIPLRDPQTLRESNGYVLSF